MRKMWPKAGSAGRAHLPHAPIMSDDGALKELNKLCSLTSPGGKATNKSKPIDTTLDDLLATLSSYKERIAAGENVDLKQLPAIVEKSKKDVDARQQEVYTALTRYGKALDKVYIPLIYDIRILRISSEIRPTASVRVRSTLRLA